MQFSEAIFHFLQSHSEPALGSNSPFSLSTILSPEWLRYIFSRSEDCPLRINISSGRKEESSEEASSALKVPALSAPVAVVRRARETFFPSNIQAARLPSESELSESQVPGVTSLVTSLWTSVRPSGTVTCSHMATLYPAATSLPRYGSTEWKGTPAIGIAFSVSRERDVRAISRTEDAICASSKNIS